MAASQVDSRHLQGKLELPASLHASPDVKRDAVDGANGHTLPGVERCDVVDVHEATVAAVAATQLNDSTVRSLAESFKALADPTRVRMLSNLIDRELCVCDLAEVLGMTQSAVSHQLRTLRMMHIVKNRREGNTVYYTCDDAHVAGLLQMGMDHIAHIERDGGGRI